MSLWREYMLNREIKAIDNFIVFDLEWNQCPFGKGRENKDIPFEIIEIGAFKLNKEKEIIDEFHRIIRPMVYKKIHFQTQKIIGMDIATLEKGEFFYRAIKDFLLWCGDDFSFATWGIADLIELQRNMKYYGLLELLPGPIRFFDVQKLFSIRYDDGKSRKSLEHAIDSLQLKKERDFHRALSDANYTAEILAVIGDKTIYKNYSIDVYQNPKRKEDEIVAVFEHYLKYISREFKSKEEAMRDREIVEVKCFKCGKQLRRKIRWFSIGSKKYYSIFFCSEHGYIKSKIRMKRTEKETFFVVKTIKLISEEEVELIRKKQELLKSKRRERRKIIKK